MSPLTRDVFFLAITRISALLAGAVVLVIICFVVSEAHAALSLVGIRRFLLDPHWLPAARAGDGSFLLLPMLAGSAAVALGAILLAAPLGVGSAIFCRFYAPASLVTPYRAVIEVLAGIPSVVFGLWGLAALGPVIAVLDPPGLNLLTASLVLGLMNVPTVALLSDGALAGVDSEQLRGAAALGLSRWRIVAGVALPSARGGILAAYLLALARALGETMAVLMVSGNVVRFPSELLQPVRTLTANIALEMAYAMDVHRAALYVSGLLLMSLVTALVLLAQHYRPEDL